MTREIAGVSFTHVCEIIPESENGKPKEFMPQSRYVNRHNLPLNKYGHGPFCKFTIPKGYGGEIGVYVVLVDGSPRYVGETEDLDNRFNMNYGNISPKNCYVGGQSTNCRINNLILTEFKRGSRIELLFHGTEDRFRVEHLLLTQLNPEWNLTTGKPSKYQKPTKRYGDKTKTTRRKTLSTRDQVLKTLSETGEGLCDDCLSLKSGVKPRQTVNQRARELATAGRIERRKALCPSCSGYKIVNLPR